MEDIIRNSPLRVGIIGCGRIFQKHCQALQDLRTRIEIVGLCDTDPSNLQLAHEKFPKATCFVDYEKMLSSSNIDAVCISTPSWLHVEMAIEALKAGKHVLCEKPLGLDYDSSLLAVNCAKEQRKLLAMVFQNRCNPPIRFLKEALENNQLGKVYSVTAIMRWYRPQSYYEDSWHGCKKKEGGMLLNQAIHYIDMLLYLTSKKPVKVHCIAKTLAHDIEIDDVAMISIEFSDGSLGMVEASTFAYPRNLEGSLSLLCERASVKIGGKALNVIEHWHGESASTIDEAYSVWKQPDVYGNGHLAIWENFIEAITMGVPLIASGEETLKTQKLIEFAYMSALKNEAVADIGI